MVKSKKMSKTSIAVIVLAIMLVLSLVLGLTGAWYTNMANPRIDGDTYTFKMDGWFNFTVKTAGSNSVEIERDANGTGTYSSYHEGDPSSLNFVIPGDHIVFSGTQNSITVTAEDATADFWYVYRFNGGNWYGAANTSDSAAGTGTNTGGETYALKGTTSTKIAINAEALDSLLTDANDDYISQVSSSTTYEVLTTLTTDNIDDTFTLVINGISIEVRAMQMANETASAAWTYLTSDDYSATANYTRPSA